MKNALVSFENVSLNYQTKKGEIKAVDNLSFNIYKDEFVSVIGPSGCGKTTVLSMIASLIKISGGNIIKDKDLKIGYMLQKDHLFEWRTVEKNVLLPLEINGTLNKDTKNYAISLLDKYGLKDFKKNYPRELSGGMRQRVALCRTLALSPDLLLLDEPFSALDYQTRLSVADDVYKIIKSEKKTTVLVTHDISEAISLSDRVLVLSKRPATLKKAFTLDLIGSPLLRRENEKFSKWFETLWKELNL